MSIHHHLDAATLMRYASGDLDAAFTIVVASHLAMCRDCRHAMHLAEAMGGQCLDEMPESDLASGAFERLSHRLDAESPQRPATVATDAPGRDKIRGDVPLPLQRLVGGSYDGIRWRKVVPGVQRHRIELAETQSSLYMLKIGQGRKIPEHGHGGTEMTLVLRGSYSDVFGRYRPGDIADLDEHIEHQPIVGSSEPCICLVATEEPTRFKGIIGRLMQPLVGI
jgi:putative transcriptional regulator